MQQEQSEIADLRQGEYGPDPESGFGLRIRMTSKI